MASPTYFQTDEDDDKKMEISLKRTRDTNRISAQEASTTYSFKPITETVHVCDSVINSGRKYELPRTSVLPLRCGDPADSTGEMGSTVVRPSTVTPKLRQQCDL